MVLAIGGGATGASIAAAMLLGIAGIAFVSLIFLIVGQSEEDDRRAPPRERRPTASAARRASRRRPAFLLA